MPKMIRVRNVSDDVYGILKRRAAVAGMSLSAYIKRDLELGASGLSFEELDIRTAARGASGLRTDTVLGALRDVRGC